MLYISGVEPQKRKKDRYNVFVDGEFAAALGAETLVVYGIKAGSEIAEETLAEAVLRDNTQYAFDSALTLLSHKMRTRSELEKRLTDRGIDPGAVDAAMQKLISYGYVDDEAYARSFVESAVLAAKDGPKAVRHKLKQKGLDNRVIDTAMQAYDNDTEKQIAASHLETLKKRYAGDDKQRQKTYAALSRRGFGYDVISSLLSGEDEF